MIIAVVLTVSLGTLVGCSVGKEKVPEQTENMGNTPEQAESAGDTPEQMKNSSQPEKTDFGISDENGTETGSSSKEILMTDDADGEGAIANTQVLTFMKEGEKEEKQATLVTDRLIYDEFLFYLPVIADTFAVIAPAEIFHGYISAFDNGAVTIDRSGQRTKANTGNRNIMRTPVLRLWMRKGRISPIRCGKTVLFSFWKTIMTRP